jgi:hypothetical protein
MDEELIEYLFQTSKKEGFKKNREDFVKYLQSDDELFDYLYGKAQKEGYKKGKDHFAGLVGRTTTAAPVATTEPAKTEVATTTTTPAKTEPAKTEPTVTVATETAPAKTEPAKELSNKPLGTVKAESIPQREVEMPVADETKMPPMMVREAAPIAEEEPKKELPVSTGLIPITEKTEVKAVETPSDKLVIKSEKKGKMKVAPEPIKIEPIKVETKGGQIQVEVPTFAIPEPRKKYKPYGDKGPDVYYSEDFDQFIIKEGNERTVASKGSPKYAEIETKLSQAAGATKEGKGKCDTPPFVGCSPDKTALNEFLYYKDDEVTDGYRSTDEGGLIEQLDDRKRTIENRGESLWSIYNNKNPNEGIGDIYYANEEPPKSDRFIVYKPYGNDKTLIYDKESGAILKQLDGKAPKIDAQKESSPIYDTKGNIIKEKRDTKETWRNYSKNNPNEGMTVWQGFEIDHPQYKELKSIIEGIDYKKAKGGTTAPKVSNVPTLEPWQQPQGTMQVKEVTEQPKVEVKAEEQKGIPSYDDLGINPEKDPGSFLGATTDKNVKFEKMSPAELIEKDMFKRRGNNIKLERNVSLRYPDPPGTVFKKEKWGDREIYSSYDEANDKWYIYDENSNKNNWTEVKAGPITTLLNSKFTKRAWDKVKVIQEKTDYTSSEEEEEMWQKKQGILLNKYLPYVMKNWDNLSDNQKEKLKKDLAVYEDVIPKNISYRDPNLNFWMDVNDKLFNSPTIRGFSKFEMEIDSRDETGKSNYELAYMKSSKLNDDIKEGKLKFLKYFDGEILYDEKNDIFYYGLDRKYNKNDSGNIRLDIIPKGTFAYDKIKSSLSKYNK